MVRHCVFHWYFQVSHARRLANRAIGNQWFLVVVLSLALAELALALIRLAGKQKKVASAAQ